MVQGVLLLQKFFLRCHLFFGFFHHRTDNINALLNSQDTGIQANIIVLSLAPVAAGIVLIIHTTALILFLKSRLRALVRLTVTADNSVCPEGYISKYENMKGIFPVLESAFRPTITQGPFSASCKITLH